MSGPAGIPAARIGWPTVLVAAVVMLATLPGRTQGLGLITEPLLADLELDRIAYATINLWATLFGALACIPAGWLIDRWGLRWTTAGMVLLLGWVVWAMSWQGGGIVLLFVLVLLTRALGQSALSVASITAVGKQPGARVGLAMGVYAVALSVLFALAFVVIGEVITANGWRFAWSGVAAALVLVVLPLVVLVLREPVDRATTDGEELSGFSLTDALRTGAFWIFAGATALFGLVSSGLGLFNEAVLAERGFGQSTFHAFLGVSTLVALVGQLLCGWLSLRWTLQRLLGLALFCYAAGLAILPVISGALGLWTAAVLIGLAGGAITVVFFAVWGRAFGRLHLGRIQGAAQMLTVFASAIGPLLFAWCHAATGSYALVLWTLAPAVLVLGLAAVRVGFPALPAVQVQPRMA